MRILVYRDSYDSRFESLVHAISKTKNTFGYSSGEIDETAVISFAPDLIIHNIPEVDKFPMSDAISININDADSTNSFSFKNTDSDNYIKPFVSLKDMSIDPSKKEMYISDVVYIGSPSSFNNVLGFLTNDKEDILFKFFSHQPHNINGYCGMCDSRDYLKFYKSARASITHSNDMNRIMDIVIADGNPIVYDGDSEDCINRIRNAVFKNERYSVDGITKESIIDKDTVYDRASEIFKKIGLKQLSENILKEKGWDK